jgi:hypothetical protein
MSEPRVVAQGMIAPVNPFVDGAGRLTGVSFRFLFTMYAKVNQLETQVHTLQQQLRNPNPNNTEES